MVVGVLVLQAGPYHLVGVGDDGGEELAEGGAGEVGAGAQLLLPRQAVPPDVALLQLLVGHELEGAVGDAEDARNEAAVEATDALEAVHLAEGVDHAAVALGGVDGQLVEVAVLEAEPGFDDPDGVGEHQGEGARLAGGGDVLRRAEEGVGGRAVGHVRLDGVVAAGSKKD